MSGINTSAQRSSSPVAPTAVIYAGPMSRHLIKRRELQARPSKSSSTAPSPSARADTSYDNPIVLSDTESNTDTIDDVEIEDSFAEPATSSTASQDVLRLSQSDAAHQHDESRSSTTLDRSYATSLNSDLHAISDGSLSSLSSVDSDSDEADAAVEKSTASVDSPRRTPRLKRNRSQLASTPSRDSEAASEVTGASSSRTPTPSRRSARIVTSGSSVQKALQRRDELDAKLLASPVRRKASTPEAPPPAKRPRGRPRKSAPVPDIQQLLEAPTAKRPRGRPRKSAPVPGLAAPTIQSNSPMQSSAASTPARRSSRLSLPASSQTPISTLTAATTSSKVDPSPQQESDREPRRSRRSQGIETAAAGREEVKQSPAPALSYSLSTPREEAKATTIKAGSVANNAAGASVQDVSMPPVKRGPGRPRKHPIVAPPALQSPATPVRGPGRPRKHPIIASPALQSPATPIAEQRRPGISDRLRKRSSPLAGATALGQSSSATPVAQPEVPRRKRGRPPRIIQSASSESATASPGPSRTPAFPLSPASRQIAIDMLDDDLSELSDASDISMDSSQPSRLSARSKAVGVKRMKRASKQDKDGKLYHVVGLYAGEADAVASTSSRRAAETPNTVLPTPIHFGAKLLTEEREFCLPFPIHQSKDQLRDKVNAKRKPPRYHQISKNKYFSRPKLQGEVPLCSCKPGSGCGADCINRMLQFICDPRTCPSASNCTNVSLGRRPAIKTTTAYYGRRGFGLKTLEPIKQDDFIDEYRGEVINLGEAAKRVTEEYKATGNYYLLDYDSAAGELLDGGRKGNITRFANHSCDPNCRIEKFIICGTDEALSAEFQIGLFANRDIEAGEELTYNYGWAAFQPRDNLTGAPTAQVPTEQCLCGAVNCSGILGGKKASVPKGAADEMKANSRTKTAKGRGKGKGKTRKTGPGSRVRMRAMTPLLTASRLSAAAMPSSALLSPKVGRSSRKREQAEASLNLLNKMVLKRQERSAREAAEIASSASATPTEGSMEATATSIQPNEGSNDNDAGALSVLDSSAKGRKAASTSRVSALSASAGEPVIAPATSIALSEALTASGPNASEEPGTSQSTAITAQANGDSTLSGAAASRLVARLPILKKFGTKRTGGAFGRASTAARGTKDRRWTAAEALMSDDDGTSSLGKELSDSDEPKADADGQDSGKKRRQAATDGARRPGRRGRHKLQLSGEEAERRAAERRARNAFLARVRRASKRGIVIEDPTQHPLKKISIECAAAPDNTYIPDLPSSLVTLGMSTADARRARNAFLARVRRAMKRGYVKEVAIKLAAKPLPGDPERDTPVMRAQRAHMEKIQQEAADELNGVSRSGRAAQEASSSQPAAAGADESWVDESSWAQ